MRALAATLLASSCLWAGQAHCAEALPDTTYCWPTVILREADNGGQLDLEVYAYRVVRRDADSVVWVTQADYVLGAYGGTDGRKELVALTPGRYLIWAHGTADNRPLADWKPPPGPGPSEVAVGFDPWKRPTQVRNFQGWSEWQVVHGNCADSLVLRVKPGDWVTMPPDVRLLLEPLQFPPGYRRLPQKQQAEPGRKP